MKILVAGRTGQVAQSLSAISRPDRSYITLGRPELDITDRGSMDAAIAAHAPVAVVNAAAYTAVDKAESEVDAAFAANERGAGILAAAAHAAGLPIVHISTDYVFAGDKEGPYTEADPVDPQSAYGRSKLAGEIAVAAANPAHVTLRTAWVFSPYGHNFLKTMLRVAAERDMLRVVADQLGSPTYAPDIAKAIDAVLETILAAPRSDCWRGTFHMAASGYCSWADFAEEIFSQSAARGGSSAKVDRITTSDYPTPAKRPANSMLDTSRFEAVFRHKLPDWRVSTKDCIKALELASASTIL